MKRRRTYTRDFKISVIREVEIGKTLAQVSRENEIQRIAVEFPAYGTGNISDRGVFIESF